jgi:multidrug resistance efflux pump
MSPKSIFGIALVAALAMGSLAACQTGSKDTSVVAGAQGTPQSDELLDVQVQQIEGDLAAAMANHDMRLYHQLRSRLTSYVGADAIRSADETYRQARANLAAAIAAHDGKARAGFSAHLRTLCRPPSLTSAIEPCEGDLAAVGS